MGDLFESKYMAPTSEVRYRDKRVSRGLTALLGVWAPFCWGLAIFIAMNNATSPKPVPAAALPFVVAAIVAFGAMFAGLAVTAAVLRTVVTDHALIVRYGLTGPTIPLSSITSCKVVRYKAIKFGGWGIRRGLDGVWAYVPGPGDVVEIAYRDGDEETRVQIGARDAHALAREIERARSSRVRVEAGERAVTDAGERAVAAASEDDTASEVENSTRRARL